MHDTIVPLRIGILGAANIARSFCRGVAGSALIDVAAVASRSRSKGEAFAAESGIGRVHDSYEALLADDAIEAVYIPLPNHLHAEWAIRAAEAGKHILCEKPLAVGATDVLAMFEATERHGVHLVEAYPYMAQPQTLRLRELLAEGVVGQPIMVSASFGFAMCAPDGTPLRDPGNIRLDPATAGGALLDAGTYPMSLIRIAAGERPSRVWAVGRDTTSGVDLTVAATIEFPTGLFAQLSCSMATVGHRLALIVGAAGAIETSYNNHASAGAGLSLQVKRSTGVSDPFVTEEVPGGDGFGLEADSFARMVRLGAGEWNGATKAESVDTAYTLEAIATSLRTGAGVDIPAG